ncbi:MAG: phosphoribosylanthranilate isomerase, partial [Candidatus Paceibacterota bacterium]
MKNLKYKICGINKQSNLPEILLLQPDFIGHIFYPKSPRNFKLEELQEFQKIDYRDTQKDAVMVNPELSLVQNLAESYNFKFFQFHGEETVSFCEAVKRLNSEIQLIKVFALGDHWDHLILQPYLHCVDFFLFDTKSEQYGGSGQSFNWELLNDYPYEVPY